MSFHQQPTSIVASEQYLSRQPWWPAYERTRPARSRLNDIVFLGHFCCWLARQGLSPSECTIAHLRAYGATLEAFRDGVRPAYAGAAHDLVEFLAAKRPASGRRRFTPAVG